MSTTLSNDKNDSSDHEFEDVISMLIISVTVTIIIVLVIVIYYHRHKKITAHTQQLTNFGETNHDDANTDGEGEKNESSQSNNNDSEDIEDTGENMYDNSCMN